jgi:putative lipoprotein
MRFALAFVLFTGGPPRVAHDPWFGRDKWLHFAASAVVQGGAYALFRQDARYAVAAQRAAIVTAAVGVGKELYDWRHPARHDASWRDLAWDGVGGVAATVVAHQVDR